MYFFIRYNLVKYLFLKIIYVYCNNKQRLEKLMFKFVIILNCLWRYVLYKNGMQKCLLFIIYLLFFIDSLNKKWMDVVIDGLFLKDGGQLQWICYVCWCIIWWICGKCYLIMFY